MFRSVMQRGLTTALLGVLLAGTCLLWQPGATRAAEAYCFPETGKCVNPLFLAYWQEHGGLAINGYPISDEIVQDLAIGQPYTVQYFERSRFEYHPENDKGSRVLLGQFGRQIHPADPPVTEQAGARFFPETGHNVSGDFLTYWQANGDLAQFGYPLSEVISEQLEDGNTYQVQYFERARFEAHPENAAPYNVLLGQFGRQIYGSASNQVVAPCDAGVLRADLMMMGAAGAREGNLHLINTGTTSCSLRGAPEIEILDQQGNVLEVKVEGPTGTETVGIAAAGRGQMITVPVWWSNYCGADPGPASLRVTLPGGGEVKATTGVSVPPCLGETQPSTFRYTGFTSGPQGEAVANVLMGYFGSIGAKDYHAAYAALGADLQAQQSYDDFAAGYATTEKVIPHTIVIASVNQQRPGYTVTLVLAASQTDGSTKTYKGSYTLAPENGSWKIVAAQVSEG